jgi:hypothetical protein
VRRGRGGCVSAVAHGPRVAVAGQPPVRIVARKSGAYLPFSVQGPTGMSLDTASRERRNNFGVLGARRGVARAGLALVRRRGSLRADRRRTSSSGRSASRSLRDQRLPGGQELVLPARIGAFAFKRAAHRPRARGDGGDARVRRRAAGIRRRAKGLFRRRVDLRLPSGERGRGRHRRLAAPRVPRPPRRLRRQPGDLGRPLAMDAADRGAGLHGDRDPWPRRGAQRGIATAGR